MEASADAAEETGGVADVTKTKQNGSRQAGMEQQSVYFVGDEGVWKCRHCIWTYQFCGPPIDHIQKHEGYCHVALDTETLTRHGTYSTSLVKGSLSTDGASGMKIREANHSINGKNKIQVNGKTEFKTKESDDLETALVSEEISDHISTNALLENGSSSNLPSNGCNEIGVGRSELEIEEDTRVELVKRSKQKVAEIDLQKVLEEQVTHDLYCPNCHSCITKRVILRKRKRTLRETQYDTPPAKVQQLPLLGATTAPADEITELDQDTEPDVFRCLSCFSFFIPTDTGFNIFRIFGRRETENPLTSQLLPATTEITSKPIFKPVGITSGESESGLPLASDNTTDFVRHMGETSTNIRMYPDTTASEAIKSRESRVTVERNDAAETGFNIFRIFGRRGTQTQQTSQLSPAKTESSHVFNPVGMTSGASESGSPMLSDSTIISVQHMGETPTNIKTYPATTTLGDFRIGRSQITTEMSHEGLSMPSDSTIVSVQHMGETSSGIQTYPDTTTVSVQHMGETSTGIQTYPDTTTTVSVQHMGETSTGIQTYPDTTTVSVQHMGGTSTSIQTYPDTTTTVSVQHMGETSTGIQTYPDTTTVSVQHMGETSTSIQTYPATTALGDFRIGLNQITTEMSGAGVQFGVESNSNSGKDPSFKEKQSPLTISVLGDSGVRNTEEGQSTNAEKAADGVNWVSFTSDGKQVADPAESSMQIYLDKTESEAPILGNIQLMTGGDMSGPISIVTSSESTSLISQNINATVPPASVVSTHVETQIFLGERSAGDRTSQNWDVLKSIVYGGLIESLTSLSIVSSAAGGDASTLNIVALGLANLIGGLFVIAHDLSELRAAREDAIDKNGRYWELLGRKANFRRHVTVAVLAYLLAGLIPPLIYGFTFRKSDNKEYKLLVVAAASFVCISLLAIGKAHVYARKAYIKSLAYYLSLSFAASGLSYVAGVMIHRFLVQLGVYDSNAVAPVPPPAHIYHGISSTLEAWASS